MKQAFARHWRWLLGIAILLDIAIATVPHITGDFANALLIVPFRWLVMAGGVFAIRWAQQSGVVAHSTTSWTSAYLVFGFTAAGLVGGAFWRFQA